VCYYAASGIGAYKQTSELDPAPIAVRRYQVGDVWNVVASRSHLSAETEALVGKLGSSEFVSMGSSLKLCLVAEGSAHLYPRLALTSEWDTAAAQCVVEQAGGKVVTAELEPLQYNTKDSLLNPYFIVCYDVEDLWSKYLH
ncbi:MAG: 3'(2'),5'-bisphosphate nucleotidase CysQ, partial [Gammaproteobacteria bacterium]|nr:3'(2'),5'-bisphosphate nucleotidase CysQ [Gammaproteobacteria bacterium]